MLRRLLIAIQVLFGITSVAFTILSKSPVGPVAMMLPDEELRGISPEE